MSDMSIAKRGNRIQEIGFAIDRWLHPQSHFHLMEGNSGKANAPADWVRGRVRVELKSCGLTFNRAKGLWQCQFYCIKTELFDELWLAIYAVTGLHFYTAKSLELLQLSSAGAETRHNGYSKVFYGPHKQLDPLEALKTIQAKMLSRGCELVAIVEWDNSSSAPHANLTSLSVEKGQGPRRAVVQTLICKDLAKRTAVHKLLPAWAIGLRSADCLESFGLRLPTQPRHLQ